MINNFKKVMTFFTCLIIALCIKTSFSFEINNKVVDASATITYTSNDTIEENITNPLVVAEGVTLTINNVSVLVSGVDKIITVKAGASLILNNVDFTLSSATTGIFNLGYVELNGAIFSNSITYSIHNNSAGGSIDGINASLYSLNIENGYLKLNSNTSLTNTSPIKVYFVSETLTLGTLVAKGNETFAGYYLDKFTYADDWQYVDTNEVVFDATLDYAGDFSTFSQTYLDRLPSGIGYGDIILTAKTIYFKVNSEATYFANLYGTCDEFLYGENSTADRVYYIKSGAYNVNGGVPMDNCKMMNATVALQSVDGVNYETSPVQTSIDIYIDDEKVNTLDSVYKFYSGTSRAVFVDIPENATYAGVSSSNTKVSAENIYTSDKFVRILLSAEMLYTNTSSTISVYFKSSFVPMPEFDFNGTDLEISGYEDAEIGDTITLTFELPEDKELVSITHNTNSIQGSMTNSQVSFDVLVAENNSIVITLKGKPTEVNVMLETDEFIYSGESQKEEIKPYYDSSGGKVYLNYVLKQDGAEVSDFTYAGEYVIEIINDNKSISLDKNLIQLTIKKRELEIVFSTTNFVYDKSLKIVTAEITNLCGDDLVKLVLSNNSRTAAGSQEMTCAIDEGFGDDYSNYSIKSSDATKTLFIDKATIVMSDVGFVGNDIIFDGDNVYSCTYNGNYNTISVNNLPEGVSVDYTNNNGHKDVGEYDIVANFSLVDGDNYYPLRMESKAIVLKIIPKEIEIIISDLTYTGEMQTAEYAINGVCDGDTLNPVITGLTNKDAKDYEANVDNLGTDNYYMSEYTIKYTIRKAQIDIKDILFLSQEKECTGMPINLKVDETTLPSVVEVAYIGNGKVLVGEYTITATFTLCDTNNYTFKDNINTKTATLKIYPKKIYIVSEVSFEDVPYDYDGSVKKIEVRNLPENVDVIYTPTNSYTNAGVYSVTATLITNEQKYELVGNTIFSAVLTINKIHWDLSGITFGSLSTTFDGDKHEITYLGTLPSGVRFQGYLNNSSTNVCDLTASAYFINDDPTNHYDIDPFTASLVISPKPVIVSLKTISLIYSSIPQTIEYIVDGLIDGYPLELKLSNATNTNAGNYTASIDGVMMGGNLVSIASTNYVIIGDMNLDYTILKANIDMTGISILADEFEYTGEIYTPQLIGVLPEGVELKSLSHNEIKDVGNYEVVASFKIKDIANYNKPSDINATIKVLPKPIFVQFNNIAGLVYNGHKQEPEIVFTGVIEDNFNSYTIDYLGKTPIDAGQYTCSIILTTNNYYIAGESSIIYRILYKTISYSNSDVNVIVEGDGFESKTDLLVQNTTDDISTIKYIQENIVENYNRLKISLPDINEPVQISLKVNNLNLQNKDRIKLYIIENEELIEINFEIKGERLVFTTYDSADILIIKEKSSSNLLVWIISIAVGLTLGALISTSIILVKKKKFGNSL